METPPPPYPQSPPGGEAAPSPSPEFPPSLLADVSPPQVGFCTTCGAAWVATWVECVPCATRRARLDTVGSIAAVERGAPITAAIALYFAILACSLGAMIAIMAHASQVGAEIGFAIVSSLLVVVWCAVMPRVMLAPLRRVPHVGWFALAAGGSLVTFAIASTAMSVLHRFAGLQIIEMTAPFTAAGYGVSFVVLLIAVQPGVFEELAFRGVVLGGLRHALSPIEAVVVSAAMFMILHLSVPSFPHLFVMGLALGWLRVRTGSLYPGMLLHFCHNLICVAWEYWRPFSPWS